MKIPRSASALPAISILKFSSANLAFVSGEVLAIWSNGVPNLLGRMQPSFVCEIATDVGVVVGSSTARKSGGVLPVHHEGDPRVLLRVEAQRVGRPTPPAKRN